MMDLEATMSPVDRTQMEAAALLTEAAEAHLMGNYALEEELLRAWREKVRYEQALVLLGFV